jgi:transcription-repair coupling factor (superfamily II helicase)
MLAHPGRARNAGRPRVQGGHPWQREFESAFIYEETPDQMRAIAETKADMERPSRWTG